MCIKLDTFLHRTADVTIFYTAYWSVLLAKKYKTINKISF